MELNFVLSVLDRDRSDVMTALYQEQLEGKKHG